MGKALSARDLTSAQIQSSFTDAQAAAAIKDGVIRDGITKMIAFGSKLSDDEIKALSLTSAHSRNSSLKIGIGRRNQNKVRWFHW